MNNKCQFCTFGGICTGFWNSVYIFKEAIKIKNEKIVSIKYNENEYGCRLSEWNDKQDKCLSNNFSEYIKFMEF